MGVAAERASGQLDFFFIFAASDLFLRGGTQGRLHGIPPAQLYSARVYNDERTPFSPFTVSVKQSFEDAVQLMEVVLPQQSPAPQLS